MDTQSLEKHKKDVAGWTEAIRKANGDTEVLDTIKASMKAAMDKLQGEYKSDEVRKTSYLEASDAEYDMMQNKSLDYLYSIRKGAPGYTPQVEELQKMNDSIFLQGKIMAAAKGTSYTYEVQKLQMYKQFATSSAMSELRKALDSTNAAPWIPNNFSPQLTEKIRLALKVAALHIENNMTSQPWTRPLEGVDATGFLVPQTTSDDLNDNASKAIASALTIQNVVFNAKKIGVRASFNEEVKEDSIIDIANYFEGKVASAMANAFENATLNGSTETVHPDFDTENDGNTAFLNERAWDGYRERIADAGTFIDGGGAGNLTEDDIRLARLQMGKYGVNVSDLTIVVSPRGWFRMMQRTEFPSIITLDKYGTDAIILTGELARFDGIPIIQSEFVREDVSSTGFNTTGGPNDLTTLTIVNRIALEYGVRRDVKLNVQFWAASDKTEVIAFARRDFQSTQPSADPWIAGIRNFS